MKATVTVYLRIGRQIEFDIDETGTGPAYFILGIRKCGSSMLNSLVEHLVTLNSRRFVDVAGAFFTYNVVVKDWITDPAVCKLLHAGNFYGGFRNMPVAIANHAVYKSAKKLLMVRDPRDALVSEYFSNAYSHWIPAQTARDLDVNRQMTALRRQALAMQIDEWVLKRASDMLRTFIEYAVEKESALTRIIKYEDYIFRKPELIALVADYFGLIVTQPQIDAMMPWIDVRTEKEDPSAFIRHVAPGDHCEKLRPTTIAALNGVLKPACDCFGYVADS